MSNTNKHVLLICAASQSVVNFRSALIKKFQQNNCKVSIIAFDDFYKDEILEMECDFYLIQENNRGMNPFKLLVLKRKISKLLKMIKPDVVMNFMLKPNIYGTLAAKQNKINKIYCMIEGAGDAFTYKTFKWIIVKKVICFFYKKSLKYANKVFFLNPDDEHEFVKLKLIKKEKCYQINGIGVDLDIFKYEKLINYNKFLMVARLKKAKGVYEYCEIAKKIKKEFPNAEFNLLGAEGDIKISDIQNYIDDGIINYLGFTKNVIPYLKDTTCLVLLSHREGLPMSIMEGLSIGRIIITTNAVGCKETVDDNYNGFKIDLNKIEDGYYVFKWILNNQSRLDLMSQNARKFAEVKFDQNKINNEIIKEVLK